MAQHARDACQQIRREDRTEVETVLVVSGIAAFLLLSAISGLAQAQTTIAAESKAPSDSSAALTHTLAANTEIHLRLLEPVASNTHKRGDRFKLEVAEPVAIDDVVVIPAGAPAMGEVVHTAKPGMAGKAGELILATRFVRVGDREVRLRSFTAGMGQNRSNLAMGLGMTLGFPGLIVVGRNVVLPAGVDVLASVASDTPLPSIADDSQQEFNNDEDSDK